MIGDRWGVSDSQTLRSYPCDDFVASPTVQMWRGVRIQAPAEAVWPWVAQLRLAPYSYDWIDNLGHRSPRELAGLPEPRVGERFTTTGGRERGRIVSVEVGEQLTATIMAPSCPTSWRLRITARPARLKVVMRTSNWIAPALSVGDLIMARRQPLNLEGTGRAPSAPWRLRASLSGPGPGPDGEPGWR